LLQLSDKSSPQLAEEPDDDLRLQAPEITAPRSSQSSDLVFDNVDSLLDFATKRWTEFWVTADIWEAATLDRFLQRPSSLLVSVDAPVSLRWKRFSDRSGPIEAPCAMEAIERRSVNVLL
jgi:dCMP deaminase